MSVTDSPVWTTQDAAELYGFERWGTDYFSANGLGHLCVSPEVGQSIDLVDLIDQIEAQGVRLPVLLRFNGIIRDRMADIHGRFSRSIEEYGYRNRYRCVFPIKVNQQCDVVRHVVESGRAFGAGIEAGSKAELIAAIAMGEPETPIICNGFKDSEYIRLAMTAQQMGREILPVIEKANELELVLAEAEAMQVRPAFGVRVKLASRGSGRWQASGGYRSKFGLTVAEILALLERLISIDKQDCFKMLHFHIGSQIGSIRHLKAAIIEGARIYVELARRGAGLEKLDVGGGLGVDYDGSRTDTPSSMNYTWQEYANDVVFHVMSVCDEAGVEHPELISESGRALVASHSVLVVETLGVSSHEKGFQIDEAQIAGFEPSVRELWDTYQELTRRNLRESFHDAQAALDRSVYLFGSGYLPLDQRVVAERLYSAICGRVRELAGESGETPAEIMKLDRLFADTYYANFSIFQSLPDAWAIQQLFPIAPIERLHEKPTRHAVIGDITCDSDGSIGRFCGDGEVRSTLRLHEVEPGERYRIGLFLVGAYQEILGDLHNLFGDTHAVHVDVKDGQAVLSSIVRGDDVSEVLGYLQYDQAMLLSRLGASIESSRASERMTAAQARAASERFAQAMDRYTYLQPTGGD
ncbi:MAG: biosynthetic arginine decarboxylase [Planctomycetota bacterium]